MILNSNMFQNCIVNGIQINYIFVRGYFINFVESCLPIFKNVLTFNQNLILAKKLILTTSDFLVSRVKYNTIQKINKNIKNDDQIKNGENNNQDVNLGKYENYSSLYLNEEDKYFIVKNYLKEYKDLKKLDENDVTVIIKGLKNIIFHFLNISEIKLNKNNNDENSFDWENIKIAINSSNKAKFFGFFSLFSYGANKPAVQNINLNRVDLPAPLTPITPILLLLGICILTSLNIDQMFLIYSYYSS